MLAIFQFKTALRYPKDLCCRAFLHIKRFRVQFFPRPLLQSRTYAGLAGNETKTKPRYRAFMVMHSFEFQIRSNWEYNNGLEFGGRTSELGQWNRWNFTTNPFSSPCSRVGGGGRGKCQSLLPSINFNQKGGLKLNTKAAGIGEVCQLTTTYPFCTCLVDTQTGVFISYNV